jgi:TP901 family phage tail tape measure protein
LAEAARLWVVVDANTTGLTRGLARAQTQLTGFDRKATGTASRLSSGLKTAAKVGGVGLAVGLGYAVKSAASFEKQMSSLGAVTKANSRQMELFRKQAVKAGADTAFSAREAAVAQTELAKGGLSVTQILKGGLDSALALAAAGELDLGEAAATTANAMNLFSMEGGKSMKVADALATAANKTTADVSDFGMALRQGGSVAKMAGLSFNETTTALMALAKIGIKNSDAGTSMKTAFLQLIGPTQKQAKLADKLNLSFVNQQGKMRSLSDISGQLRDSLGGMGDAQRTAHLKTLAGTDGVRTLSALYEAGPAKLKRYSEELGRSGTAAEVAARKQDNLSGDVEKLTGSLETLAIQGGGKLTPFLRSATQEFTAFINQIGTGEGVGGRFADVVGNLASAIGNVGSALAPTLGMIGGFAGNLLQLGSAFAASRAGAVALVAVLTALAARWVAMQIGGTVASLLTVGRAMFSVAGAATVADLAMRKFSVALKTNPVGIIATAVGLLAGAFIGLSASQSGAAQSANDLANANDGLYESLKQVTDLDLDAQQRKLNLRRSTMDLASAERNLTALRKSGTASARELKAADLAVDEARLRVKRDTRDLNRVEEDHRSRRAAVRREAEQAVKTGRESVAQLRKERDGIKDQVNGLEEMGRKMSLSGGQADELRQKKEALRAKDRELTQAQRELNASIAAMRGKTVDIRVNASGAMAVVQSFRATLMSIPRSITTVAKMVRAKPNAAGTKTNGPELALIGEGGGPEYVIPTESKYRRRGVS